MDEGLNSRGYLLDFFGPDTTSLVRLVQQTFQPLVLFSRDGAQFFEDHAVNALDFTSVLVLSRWHKIP
jgi:hypothetical protein